MLLKAEAVASRVDNPNNLLNRLRKETGLRPNIIPGQDFKPAVIVSIPRAEEIIPDIETKLADGLTANKAKLVLDKALDQLAANIENVKPEKLSAVAKDMSTIINGGKDKGSNSQKVQVIVYNPEPRKVEEYATITV